MHATDITVVSYDCKMFVVQATEWCHRLFLLIPAWLRRIGPRQNFEEIGVTSIVQFQFYSERDSADLDT